MSLKFWSLSSGSSGNCYLVASDTTALLIDAGISGKKILEGVDKAGLLPEDISCVLVTHEHDDHVKGLRIITNKIPGLKAFANRGTWKNTKENHTPKECNCMNFETGCSFDVGNIHVTPFPTSHDAAEPVGFSLECDGRKLTIATDTGYVTEEVYRAAKDSDLLVLEANHDVEALMHAERYPYFLRQRIKGDKGHLSNETAGCTLCRILEESSKPRQVLLAHLSKETNFPEMARITVCGALEEQGYYTGENLKVDVLLRDKVSKCYKV